MSNTPVISVVGLGYVGLPLAVALANHFRVVGFDIGQSRITELRAGHDRTNEVESERLKASPLKLTADAADMKGSDVFIVTVPTPVDEQNEPDLAPVLAACRTLGTVIGKEATIVFESTVYPGVTEDLCGPELEKVSGLKCGVDFWLGYSTERINPGDRQHRVERITKVIAGQTPQITELLATIYGKITTGGVFRAASIKAAEAAKAIENAQRDINIAFINEVTMIFNKLGLSVHDVLDASATKWNFLPFRPGLVGGHCIGVDPYYLARCALDHGHDPQIILAGRRLNDRMGRYIADSIADNLTRDAQVLVLGLTFKENVPDLRNSKVIDVINGLRARGLSVNVHDPLANASEALHEYGVTLLSNLDGQPQYDAVVGAVSHDAYSAFGEDDFGRLVRPGGLIADIKGMWRSAKLPEGLKRWSL
jgi:UDP-N-acetyl-D-galactosamine dehydrogenase